MTARRDSPSGRLRRPKGLSRRQRSYTTARDVIRNDPRAIFTAAAKAQAAADWMHERQPQAKAA